MMYLGSAEAPTIVYAKSSPTTLGAEKTQTVDHQGEVEQCRRAASVQFQLSQKLPCSREVDPKLKEAQQRRSRHTIRHYKFERTSTTRGWPPTA